MLVMVNLLGLKKRRSVPFECWTPNVEAIKQNSSMELTSDQPIVAERHMHNKTNILDFVGAAFEYETVGERLFFPELVAGALDWFRFFNVGEADAFVNIIIRNRQGDIVRQRHTRLNLCAVGILPKVRWGM